MPKVQFADPRWRLSNLYWITDKHGRRVQFRMNSFQQFLYDNLHYCSIVLKARQLGVSTFAALFALDQCLFNSDTHAGVIAHTLDAAQALFKSKVRYAYEALPDALKTAREALTDTSAELGLNNRSTLRVGLSLRSATLQVLHVSEFASICTRFPDRAQEVITGALNTLAAGQICLIESTAMGSEDTFCQMYRTAESRARMGQRLGPLDFKPFFLPWWQEPEYELPPDGVVVDADYQRYFAKLRDQHGIELTPRKMAWYVRKAETQLDAMKREFPSYPAEAFEVAVEGAYYGALLAKAELQGRIGGFPAVDGYVVHTAWDLGMSDAMTIWAFQILPGPRLRLVGYLEGSGEPISFYVRELERMRDRLGWSALGHMFVPQDAKVRSLESGRTRVEAFGDHGVMPRLVPAHKVDDGIQAARTTLPLCEFDEVEAARGLACLRNYRKEWDDQNGCWRDKPKHDWASHGADSFRYLSMSWRDHMVSRVGDFLEQTGKAVRQPYIRWEGKRVLLDVGKTGGIPLSLWPLDDLNSKRVARAERIA